MSLILPEEFIVPDYDGQTIGNVPATIAALLDAPFEGLRPLTNSLWQPLGRARRVVLFIVDALGWNLFQQERQRLSGIFDHALVEGQITSIFPSTTVAALSTLWSGLAPAQHGMLGLELFMPDFAVTMQTLGFTPAFDKYPDALVKAGLVPETFLHGPGFAEQLAVAGVPSYAFKGREIVNSALSKMHGRGLAGNYGVLSPADMFVQIRTLLEERVGQSLYVNAYWPTIDTMTHIYNWDHAAVAAEFRAIMRQLDQELLSSLSFAARRDTVFLLVADHGQTPTPPEQQIYLEDHPDLRQLLFMTPAGEPRTPYLYVKHGRQTEVMDYIKTNLNQAMVAIPADQALSAGLMGPLPHAPTAIDRVGDIIVTMQSGYVLLTEKERESAKILVARHGGMTSPEMRVPWVGFRLDA